MNKVWKHETILAPFHSAWAFCHLSLRSLMALICLGETSVKAMRCYPHVAASAGFPCSSIYQLKYSITCE
jgi:hypothetical protein